ncbi:hypothetical protein AU252_01365 [Pseudarthrobacter sulfonivorans]|uniref:Uncharacterized protein n=1 Tax=Pseudarthrobacter sulfonivorans TaxID=121292 RepID=A0A0U3QSW4_9MICC|nr:hypothetical protein AU252_01365 [Pseudarthrobacter sulfonivorans]
MDHVERVEAGVPDLEQHLLVPRVRVRERLEIQDFIAAGPQKIYSLQQLLLQFWSLGWFAFGAMLPADPVAD